MKRRLNIAVLFTLGLLNACSALHTQKIDKTYSADWASLAQHNEAPEWFSDAKLGIYFHWGVYSVPAFSSEWYPHWMYREGTKVYKHHVKHYGDPATFNYHDFIPMFKGGSFDAKDWAQLFKEAGAKFAGPVAQHHDGFAMWDSDVNPWNVADKGPKIDITGKLKAAVSEKGLKFITTFHHARLLQRHGGNSEQYDTNNSHFLYDREYATSSNDSDLAKLYGNMPEGEFNDYWFAQLKEVIDQYSPDIIWFDSWLNMIPDEYKQDFAAYYLNEAKRKKQEVVIAFKQNDLPKNLGIMDIEQGGKRDVSDSVWLTDVTLSTRSWSHIKGQQYKSPELVIRNMIDVWSKNGVVLLNISPTADGLIPQEQRHVLKVIGQFMRKYAEAIYETRPYYSKGFGSANAKEGKYGGQSATVKYTAKDGRFMMSKDEKTLYLFMLGKPTVGDKIRFSQLAGHSFFPKKGIKQVSLMNSNIKAKWRVNRAHFEIFVPKAPMDDIATVFKIEFN